MELPFGGLLPISEPSTSPGLLGGWAVSVTRIRASDGGEDRYGVAKPGALQRTELPGGLFMPTGSADASAAGVSSTVTEPAVMWPGQHPDVRTGDVLEIDGDRWRVHERPQTWPLGLVVTLKGVEKTGGGS